jgi:NAD(P)-dependent dehydrogenase (short-subunit alcohol dehydrogenase family)
MAGEIVVVTGASAGVGRAAAVEFARQGAAKVALLARDEERLHAAAREVEAAGAQALAVPTDVADPAAIERAAEAVERELGAIDVWVNNAMATVLARFLETTPEEYRRATEVTYLGYVYGTMAALERMAPRGRGVIVQVGSALAYRGIPLQAAYCGAKHAIQGFTESVRCELMHDGVDVRLTMVQLPALNTPQFQWARSRLARKPQPVPPIFQPDVAARAVVWAARHRRRELYVGLSTVVTVWGDKLAPALGDRYLARTGFESQQTSEPAEAPSEGNLFEPVAGDYAAHGPFDDRAHARSAELWAATHRRALVAAGGVLLAALGLVDRLRRR